MDNTPPLSILPCFITSYNLPSANYFKIIIPLFLYVCYEDNIASIILKKSENIMKKHLDKFVGHA